MNTTANAAGIPSIANPERPLMQRSTAWKLATAAVLAALADWLFYDRSAGISIALFLLALGIGAVVNNRTTASRRDLLIAAGVLIAAFTPLAMQPGFLAFLFAIIGVGYVAWSLASPAMSWRERIGQSAFLPVDWLWRAAADTFKGVTFFLGDSHTGWRPRLLIVWIVPFGLGGIFLLLFVSANPVIESWFSAIDLKALISRISFGRLFFWLLSLAFVWPFIFLRARRWLMSWARDESRELAPAQTQPASWGTLFGPSAILRSLVLFNLLFAVQGMLDATYLWGGVALPAGVSHAGYAHRGAYPLIVTALLAAAFVILATRPGSEAAQSRPIRLLVFLFVAQNVALVVSSMLRLDLYVAAYSLTYWRVAAFIWMLLVAVGLVLIVVRLVLGRSNGWLLGMNFVSLVLTLYVCGFVNFASVIAHYNVAHSQELKGGGGAIDVAYLRCLGPHAIPAIDIFIEKTKWPASTDLALARKQLAGTHLARMNDWRAWSVRDWRLVRYLAAFDEANRAAAAPAGTPP